MSTLTEMPDELTQLAADLRHVVIEAADPITPLNGMWTSLLGAADSIDEQANLAEAKQLSGLGRYMVARDALVARAQNLRFAYVWGSGLQIAARAKGEDGEQDVDAVVQAFLGDPSNADALCSVESRAINETSLGTDGNILLALFTNPVTGRVQARVLPFDEVTDAVTDPEDSATVWFYRRERTVRPVGGAQGPARRVVTYHPALGYRPRLRPRQWGSDTQRGDVLWDAPVRHVRVNAQRGQRWGSGDLNPALPWARAYSVFLEDWARLVKALSRFAWKATGPTTAKVSKLAQSLAGIDGWQPNPPAGAIAGLTTEQNLTPIPKTGATIDSESGRPLAAMVAAACDVPVTQLLADPGVTGARATAETLDRPTWLMAKGRRDLWTQVWRDVLGYVIDAAVRAPSGPLTGTVTVDQYAGADKVTVTGSDRAIDVVWPPLDDVDPKTLVEAIAIADGTGKMPPRTVVVLLLQALGVDDADAVADDLFDEQGRFIDPDKTAGDVAVDAFRNGQDPAAATR